MWAVDELMRTFELGSRAGKGGFPKALPPSLLNDPGLDALYGTFAAMRNGDDYDKVAAKMACYALSQGPASPASEEWKDRMYSAVPADWGPGGAYNLLIAAQVSRLAGALGTAQTSSSSVTQYYIKYCF